MRIISASAVSELVAVPQQDGSASRNRETQADIPHELDPEHELHPTNLRPSGHPADDCALHAWVIPRTCDGQYITRRFDENWRHSGLNQRNILCDDSQPDTPTADHDFRPRDRRHDVESPGAKEFRSGPSRIAQDATSLRRLVGPSQH